MKNLKHRINSFAAVVSLLILAAVAFSSPAFAHTMGFQMGVAAAVGHLIVHATSGVDWLHATTMIVGRCDEPTLGDVVVEFRTAKVALEQKQKGLEDAHKLVQKSIEESTALNQTVKENIDKQIIEVNEQKAVLRDIMQKMDEMGKQNKSAKAPLTIRSALAQNIKDNQARYDEFKSNGRGKFKMELKAITTAGAAGLLPDPFFDGVLGMTQQPLKIRNLLTTVPVLTDSVRYAVQSLRTNAAKIVAEGTAKPYSAYAWTNQTATIETIAHLAKLTLQAIADAPRLTAEVESEMRYGQALLVENELLNGDGTAGHLNGIMAQSTAYAAPAGITAGNIKTKIDVLRVAQLQLAMKFAPADAQILSLVDWADIELLRDGMDRYLFGSGPQQLNNQKTLWSLPVIDSASMPVDNFLVAALGYSVHLYDRQEVNVLISTENDTDFEMNQATMRCEERLGLGVRRPDGLVKGTFSTAIPAP